MPRLITFLLISSFLLSLNIQGHGNDSLKSKKTLRVTTCNWEPYVGKDLKDGGFVMDITRQAFKRVGYNIKVFWLPWARALKMSESGWYDVLANCYITKEREKSFEFSDPITTSQVAFLELTGRNIKFEKLTDLVEYNIGVVRGYAYTTKFDTASFLQKDLTRNSRLNIGKLLLGRVDLIIDGVKLVKYLTKKYYPGEVANIHMIKPVLKTRKIYNAISKKSPNYKQITKDFDRGLKELKEDGTFDKILKKHGILE